MSDGYIEAHFSDIARHANVIETRLEDGFTKERALRENAAYRRGCKRFDCPCYEITGEYSIDAICREF